MKKILIIFSVIIGIFIVFLLLLPLFLQGNISEIIEKQSAKYLNAELQIEDMRLSMFKSFPDLNVRVKNIVLCGKGEFEGDTVAAINTFNASVNVMSLIKGEEIIVKKIYLKDARLNPEIGTSGQNNWDILIRKTTDTTDTKKAEFPKEKKGKNEILHFNDIQIENLSLNYTDIPGAIQTTVGQLNLNLSGNLSAAETILKIDLQVKDIFFRQQNTVWISHSDLQWQAELAAALQERSFDIQKNTLVLNDLRLDLNGKVAQAGDKTLLDLRLNTPDTRFESLLALLPKTYKEQLSKLQTSGNFTFELTAKGEYYKDHLPAFDLHFNIDNARAKYEDLPEAIENINMALNVKNPGGPSDSTDIDLQKLSFTLGGNPFDVHLQISELNDPLLNGGAKGSIDFNDLKKVLPLQGVTLEGSLQTSLTFQGRYKYIEQKQYEKFTAKGDIQVKDIFYANTDFPKGIHIPTGTLRVTPAELHITDLQAKVNSSDLKLKGYVSGYLPYILKKETLKGNFTLSSDRLDLNEFITPNTPVKDTTNTQAKGDIKNEAPIIPANLQLQINTDINTILFDKLKISKVRGKVSVANASAILDRLSMNLLEGNMEVSGKYTTEKYSFPHFDLRLNVSDLDIHSASESFSFVRNNLPITMNCEGKISSVLNLSSDLSMDMSVRTNTLNGSGYIDSKGILINENPAMLKLASVVKNDELSRLSISSLKVDFKIDQGNITIAPFTTRLAGNPATIWGSQTVDGKIDYTISMNIDRKFFGQDIENLLRSIPGSKNIQNLDIDAKITGTLNRPQVQPDLSKAINKVRKAAEKDLKNKALKGLEKLFK